jgi:DNA-binding MarR family transcriptional regulator
VTNRIDRVENLGLVRRIPDPNDRRGVVVQLTARGRTLADRAIALHFAEMSRLLEGVSAGNARSIAGLLRELLISFESLPPRKANGKANGKANDHKPSRNGRRAGL